MIYQRYILQLDSDLYLLGKKAAAVSLMSKIASDSKDFYLPKSIVISINFFKDFLDTNSLHEINWDNLRLPNDFMSALMKIKKEILGETDVVVRSSATCEDSPLFSFAGQYKSFLNLSKADDIEKAIILCYKSFISENVKLYAEINNINLKNEAMAILIQEMIPVKKSGILFTINPVNNRKSYLIECTDGLGDSVVSGYSDCCCIEFDKASENIDPLYNRLAKIGDFLEGNFRTSLDIEWGYDGTNIYIFQVRPVIACRKLLLNDFKKPEVDIIQGNPISNNVTMGYLFMDNDTDIKNKIIIYDNKNLNYYKMSDIAQARGIVLINGGKLSHFSNIIREFNKPCISISQKDKLEKYLGTIVVLDAGNAKLYLLKDLDPIQKFNYLWNSFLSFNNNHVFEKMESVIFDIDEENFKNKLQNIYFEENTINYEHTYTFDFEDKALEKNNSYIRINHSKNYTIIQFKQYSLRNCKCRKEINIVVKFENLIESFDYLENFGLINTGSQERIIKSYSNNNICFKIITWPNAKPFVGIEGVNEKKIKYYCKLADINYDNIVYTDGKDIFNKLNLKLEDCRF